jgi:hypothetical protein
MAVKTGIVCGLKTQDGDEIGKSISHALHGFASDS